MVKLLATGIVGLLLTHPIEAFSTNGAVQSHLFRPHSRLLEQSPADGGENKLVKTASVVRKWEQAGLSLKTQAHEKHGKIDDPETTKAGRFGLQAQACLLYSLFIVFRGLNGVRAILPGAFAVSYERLGETVVSLSPFEESNGQVWQTRITVSALSLVLVSSYVIGGLVRVLNRLVRTVVSTKNLFASLEQAAELQEQLENQVAVSVEHQREPKPNGDGLSSTNGDSASSNNEEKPPKRWGFGA